VGVVGPVGVVGFVWLELRRTGAGVSVSRALDASVAFAFCKQWTTTNLSLQLRSFHPHLPWFHPRINAAPVLHRSNTYTNVFSLDSCHQFGCNSIQNSRCTRTLCPLGKKYLPQNDCSVTSIPCLVSRLYCPFTITLFYSGLLWKNTSVHKLSFWCCIS